MDNDTRWATGVRVDSLNGFAGVFAAKRYRRGDRLLPLRGRAAFKADRYSIQVGIDQHLHPGYATNGAHAEVSPWKFLNHSCDPNLEIDLEAKCFRARREIAEGEELSFNYLTTEWEMASPFECICGSRSCYGMIQGFRHLSREEQERLLPATAPHIRLLFEALKLGDSAT